MLSSAAFASSHIRRPKRYRPEASSWYTYPLRSKVNSRACMELLGNPRFRVSCEIVIPCHDFDKDSKIKSPRSNAGTDCVLSSDICTSLNHIGVVPAPKCRHELPGVSVQPAGFDLVRFGIRVEWQACEHYNVN